MQVRQVSYGRKISDGNYGSIVFDVAVILEEGESEDQAAEYLVGKVNGLLEDVRAREKAWDEEERKQHQPWKATPGMVSDYQSLPEKALAAARLHAEHQTRDTAQKAHEEALRRFGVDVPFDKQLDGSAAAEVDGLTLIWQYNDFSILIPVEGEPKPRKALYVSDLTELGTKLAALRGEIKGADPDEPPF